MRRKLAASLIFIASLAIAVAPAPAESISTKVIAVIYGDTLKIQLNESKEKVILYGIDCPEIGQDYGAQAKKFTDDKCYGKVVTIEQRGLDKNGRIIGVVTLPDGTNLNQELVRQGLAWWSDKYAPKDETLKKLHQEAKTAKRGLWVASNPIPPWIFRNGQRGVQGTVLTK